MKICSAPLCGAHHMRMLRNGFPKVPLVSTRGISLADAVECLHVGSVASAAGNGRISAALRRDEFELAAIHGWEVVMACATLRLSR